MADWFPASLCVDKPDTLGENKMFWATQFDEIENVRPAIFTR